jgi:hypothetical protein
VTDIYIYIYIYIYIHGTTYNLTVLLCYYHIILIVIAGSAGDGVQSAIQVLCNTVGIFFLQNFHISNYDKYDIVVYDIDSLHSNI